MDPEEGKVRITVKRKNTLSMPNVVLHVSVDHKHVGKITVNGTIFFDVEPGEHFVEVSVFHGIRTSGTFMFREGTVLQIFAKLGKIELSVSDQ